MFDLWDSADEIPPPPPSSAVFVMRNGRYEPQNLMPVLPRPDVLDFDGFVMRRGATAGYRHVRPPEMRQATLVKNPVSVRRDSARAVAVRAGAAGGSVEQGTGESSPEASPGRLVLSFTFDAASAGNLSLHLLVSEVERCSGGGRRLELLPRAGAPAAPLCARPFPAGLGQQFESPAFELAGLEEQLAVDPARPADVPLAVQLEAEDEGGSHFAYISLHRSPAPGPPQWSAHIFAQKLQYGDQCFVLHEVFGARSRSLDEVDCGSADCVICLSAPRDTAVLPCRHMCFCSYCAGIVRLQCDRCPVCRQKVKSLLQFKRDLELGASTPEDESSGSSEARAMGVAA
mmetsp:Transcript_101497/g.287586  ORF Transcript_101497/g.287586 Transcript_101497/m.287586 type:complete len:344 (+) Transcript_101497:125-1156(+)|eukprot:CAMPEP_0168381336 /NCGR_PEP_ID=MMETSP0228-20121227/12826_1 /TAXON_ID=133427 /ORGANISM="Protoceratium reticulatum, Strain CCCM 535 (=CCMP 1889)" /LENGTH=343 /DNA_ID=CAMNT_0008394435 /DNA_START=124 /DNA_END=1155 /DNA_ORIENTATION=+